MYSSRTKIWIIAALLWSVLIGSIAWKSINISQTTIIRLAEVQARASVSEDKSYQKWAAMHGGVYVPVTTDTPPNPFLAHMPDRDISTPSGTRLTLINHAYITRQIHESIDTEYGVQGRITSLNPIRPENAPDKWEQAALTELQRTGESIGSIEYIAGKKYLRMIFALQMENDCLKCHVDQGLKPGDRYGGISISVAFAPFQAAIKSIEAKILMILLSVWLLGLALILFAYRVIRSQFLVVEKTLMETKTIEKKYRTLFDHAAGGICVADMETGKITDCNRNMTELIGRSRDELIGQAQSILFPISEQDHSGGEIKQIWRYRGDDVGKILEKQIVNSDGELIDVQIKAAPIEIEGRKLLQGFFYDITMQKKLHAQAIRSSQLASVGELSAGVAHEINNPIGGVINYAQILLNQNSTDEFERDILNKIIKEGQRIAQIVRSLLSFSRKGEDKQYIYDLKKIITEPLTLINAHIIRDAITINLNIPKNLPAVKCNPQQIEQLVLNLINNSRYALNEKYPREHENKRIEIFAEVAAIGQDKFIQMTFVDYGTGIPTDKMPTIKEAFSTTKPHGKGTGLGLSICEEIVSNHGGRLEIESDFGEFTKSTVYLPVESNIEH
jgi:PAS domain S-box-containing protein